MKRKFHFGVLAALSLGQPAFFHEKADDNKGGVLDADFKSTLLTGLKDIQGTQSALGKSLAELQARHLDFEAGQKTQAEQMLEIRKIQLAAKATLAQRASRPGAVSEDCARWLGALAIRAAFKQELVGGGAKEEALAGIFKDIMGIEVKTALSTSDIPMPTGYSGDVAELVYEYGQARKWGTVFPLPNGIFKIPKLGTDTTFTLNAISASITEKSPTISNVTFTAEKFGGLIRLPTEIEDDSVVAIGQFIGRYAARQMARAEDHNFWAGSGAATGVNGTAEGLTKSVVTDTMFYYNGNSSTSGKTKGSEAVLADFRGLRAIPNGAVLGRAAYYMHPTYESLLVGFNTSSTVTPYVAMGPNGPTLDGFPIRWVPELPALSTSAAVSAITVLFGDASFNYLGIRGGMRFDISREAGFATDEVLIRALERFTIGKMATDCVAGLRNAAS